MSGGGPLDEVKVLLHGLWTAGTNPQALNSLPSTRPEFGRDVQVFFIFAVGLFIFNWGARKYFIEPVLQCSLNLKDKMKEKFGQSAMEMIMYGGFTGLGLLVVPRQEWIWPSSLWWIGFAEGSHAAMRADLRCYYLMYGARYFQGGISVFLEHKRKDFWEMQVHHWTTVALIYISYFYGWNRIGCCIMLLLDPADAILHIAKMCKYTSDSMLKENPRKAMWQSCADVWFAIFSVVFFVTRLLLYPYVCWSAHIEATRYFPKGVAEWTCVALLELLMVLQCYWFYLLVSAIVRMFTAGGIEDVRSDDETEDEAEGKETKKEN